MRSMATAFLWPLNSEPNVQASVATGDHSGIVAGKKNIATAYTEHHANNR
jgi:hypothetical protein